MSESGWHLKEYGSEGADLSKQFQDFLLLIRASKPVLPEEAKTLVVLLVPGLFTENYPTYMNENVTHLSKLNLAVRKVKIDTDVGVAANAEAVRVAVEEVAAEGKRVILVGHSKGGVDAAHAIVAHDLYRHVRAFVTVQAPHGGTPMVDLFAGSGPLEVLTRGLVTKVLRGDMRALQDLSYASRRTHFPRLDSERLPTVCFLSTGGEGTTLMTPMQAYLMKRHQLESDGAVAPQDAKLPRAPFVALAGLDHGGTVFAMGRAPLARPGEIFEALVALALLQPTDGGGGREVKEKEKKKKGEDDKKDKKEKKEKKADNGDEDDDKKKEKKEKKDKKDKK